MENKHKIIIIALIVIIAALLVAIVAVMPNLNKQGTDLTFKSKSTLTEGDVIKIKLTDDNWMELVGQTVNITITDQNNANSYYSVETNSKGIGILKLDKTAGKYTVTAIYGGNDKYVGCNVTKKITVKEEVVEAKTSSTSTNYDSGAFYSPQAGRVIYTGEIMDGPGGKQRHLGNNQWEPV